MPDSYSIMARLASCRNLAVQEQLKAELRESVPNYGQLIRACQRANPFLELSEDELQLIARLEQNRRPASDLLEYRYKAANMAGRKIAVLSMPKSGSSFIQSSIKNALRLRFADLTSSTLDGNSSLLGINGRHQELDEFAIILNSIDSGGSWVSQTHTPYTPYLGSLLQFYRIKPIVIVRNIFDSIVSMDDMMTARGRPLIWRFDPPFALPNHYQSLDISDRLRLLCRHYGHWLVDFNVSWLRARRQEKLEALWLRFEDHVTSPHLLAASLIAYFTLDEGEASAVKHYCRSPNKSESRFNIGKIGRGTIIPTDAKEYLVSYAAMFSNELGEKDLKMMFFHKK